MALLGLICAHLQLVVGLVIYFISPLGIKAASGEAMKISTSRLYFLEHPLMMLIAIILITVGYSKAKKLTVAKKQTERLLAFTFMRWYSFFRDTLGPGGLAGLPD